MTSRGFGYVIFKSEDSLERAIQNNGQIKIKGRTIDCKRVFTRQEIKKDRKHSEDPTEERYEDSKVS
jgi:RNA recognition motif-containing protein